MELAILQGFDPKLIASNQKRFKKVLADTLEQILIENKYKSQTVRIDKRFACTEMSEIENSFEGSSEFQLPKFIKYAAPRASFSAMESDHMRDLEKDSLLSSEEGSGVQVNIQASSFKKHKKNYVKANKIAMLTQNTVLQHIRESTKPLCSQNIPYLSSQTNFSRTELHAFYTLYKALCFVTSQRYGVMKYGMAK